MQFSQNSEIKNWFKISLLSFFIVSVLGMLLRYKMAFSLPWMNQKFTQHAHSHFAFAAWVSQTIWLFIYAFLSHLHPKSPAVHPKWEVDLNDIELADNVLVRQLNRSKNNAKSLLRVHLFTAYGMLIGFLIQGYGLISIVFSSLYLVVSAAMVAVVWDWLKKKRQWMNFQYLSNKLATESTSSSANWKKELNALNQFQLWLKASFIFQLLSCLGTISLVNQMIQHHPQQNWYLASVYWFLHFTYNGWFFFAVMGLFIYYLIQKFEFQFSKRIFWLLTASCIPAYGLSTLWLQMPTWVYSMVVVAVVAQTIGYGLFIGDLVKNKFMQKIKSDSIAFGFLLFLFVALTSKMGLQLFSVIPSISKLAFGFRPVVIAYIHLMLLSVISVFLIYFGWQLSLFPQKKLVKKLLWTFLFLIMINQLSLGVQAIASLSYTWLPWLNTALVFIAFFLAINLGTLFFLTKRR